MLTAKKKRFLMLPIFDELVYAEKLLTRGFTKLMSHKDLEILAKFYFFKRLDEEQTRKKLNAFCYKYNPEYNEVIFGKSIDDAIKAAKKDKLHIPEDVVITKAEIERIKLMRNYRVEKLLFVILVCTKYHKQDSNRWRKRKDPDYCSDRFFVNPILSPYLSLAKVYANRREQEIIGNDLMIRGYIISDTKNKNPDGWWEILYADNDYLPTDIFAKISSRDNILDFYPPYFVCLGCGKETDKVGNNRKYCEGCWSKTKNERNKIHMQKTRQKA